ncbi:MAG: histidine kinase [Acidobacteria bacterium RIFCSPLOWO2_12_FULL_67_14b]|nr:MAG: histidine kinase [Acidobacteria bacterium RIFCSPLOWO2_12_FULL_67_14b]
MAQQAFPLPPWVTVLKESFRRLSLSVQFLMVSFMVLVSGMAILGSWLGRQIETNSVNRAAAIAAVYVESILAAQLGQYAGGSAIDGRTRASLDGVFVEGPLRRKVVRFKLWDSEGTILYSSDHAQVGRRFTIEGLLAGAFAGAVQARISDLDEADNASERERWTELIEVYVPLRTGANGKVTTVAEFYHSMESLRRDIRAAKQRSWALVAVTTAAMYLLLISIVRRANTTIVDQQRDLRRQLQQLRTTLGENVRMRERLREAGARTTALNEQFLHRVAADLHDGPAQEIALALMRLETLGEGRIGGAIPEGNTWRDFETIHRALDASLAELRVIASGLGMPGIADLSFADTVIRAVRDFEDQFGTTVNADVDDTLDDAPLAIRITVYRLLKESLTNGWLHARGAAQRVRARRAGGQALIEVADQGPGFVPQAAFNSGRLGLEFMRERVLLVGGTFEIASEPGSGTRVLVRLPLSLEETAHG